MTKRSADNRPPEASAEAPIETSGFADSTGSVALSDADAPQISEPEAELPMPPHGGSFIRQPDGSLIPVQED